MNHKSTIILLPALSACALATACHGQQVIGQRVIGQQVIGQQVIGHVSGKVAVEAPVKTVLNAFVFNAVRADDSKRLVEAPIKNLLKREVARRLTVVNKVTPGKVRWHASFAAAKAAAKKSGKPVLHFQMLGRLDQEFC